MSPILGGIAGVSTRGFGQFVNLYFSSFDSIATVTVGAGGTATVTFSSIPSGYTHLQIRGIGRSTTTGNGTDYLLIQFNSDTGNNYAYHQFVTDGGTISTGGSTSVSSIICGFLPRANQLANAFGVQVIDILDYANTNKNKVIRSYTGMDYNGTSNTLPGQLNLRSGVWLNTNAITSITLKSEANNLTQYSQLALYGIKVA